MAAKAETMAVLKDRLEESQLKKLLRIEHPGIHEFVARWVQHCRPENVFVCSDDPEDIDYIRQAAIRRGEEGRLAIAGHTYHFDNYDDQARDKEHTCILLPAGKDLGPTIRTADREASLAEIREVMKDIMKGKELYVRFFCLGPTHSVFSMPAVQLTDSAYVAHNEDLLYRWGYQEFLRQGPQATFFKFVHSAGQLDERNTSRNLDRRRIYIDLMDDIVYSANTQYGGNTIGLKKLAMRLAINRASREGWLCEHMLVMGVHGPGGRVTYLTGAFPSLCGKTSTAMLDGETIVGDDIAYLRAVEGRLRAVNVEKGIFGIIQGINSKDDPLQWKALHEPNEIIFSNVLVTEGGGTHWIGRDGQVPPRGQNHSGPWHLGKKDDRGKEIPPSHPNARFTIKLEALDNLDPRLDDPDGVEVGGIVYGGRDSDTWVPVEEAFDWAHGIIAKGASLESETTAATLGAEGVRVFNPMSNLDFLSVPIGRYLRDNLKIGDRLKHPPRIFSVNYFLKDKEGRFLNQKNDKKVWYKWIGLRIHGEVEAIETPTGRIPVYRDLAGLFQNILGQEYSRQDYDRQFTLRVRENLGKIDRIERIYRTQVSDAPDLLFEELQKQRQRLVRAADRHGHEIQPERFLRS
jgi:phosphoenolpyruvate carboxykinase (GTP)